MTGLQSPARFLGAPSLVAQARAAWPGPGTPDDALGDHKLAALQAVVQRPRELTRADLKALRAELDRQGFSEAALRHAWRQAKNEDIAATIVGFIRQAAVGDLEAEVRSFLASTVLERI